MISFAPIERPRDCNRTASHKSAASGGSDFARFLGNESKPVSGAGPAFGVAGVGALLAAGEDGARRRTARAKARAEELLEKMDVIRVALVTGELRPQDAENLAASVQTLRDQVDDPRLSGILDEIDLRAQVELAKFEPVTA